MFKHLKLFNTLLLFFDDNFFDLKVKVLGGVALIFLLLNYQFFISKSIVYFSFKRQIC
jgi:hypothetical protein